MLERIDVRCARTHFYLFIKVKYSNSKVHEAQIRSAYRFLLLDSVMSATPKFLYKKSSLGSEESYRGMSAACRLMVWQSHHSFYIRVAIALRPFRRRTKTKKIWLNDRARNASAALNRNTRLTTKCVSTRELEVAEEGEQIGEATKKNRRKMKQI